MPSRLDAIAATDFDRGMAEVKETVIRRIGGSSTATEPVEAVVELDEPGGGFRSDQQGQRTELAGYLELAAGQANSGLDKWVINGEVFKQSGEATSKDGGSQTVRITRRIGRTAAEPKVRNR